MRYISTRKALLAFIACALSSAAFGEAYTNHAGRAVSGKLTAITNCMAVISGRSLPLSVFPDSEQTRMRLALAVPLPLPPALEASRCSLRNRILRSEALCDAGAKSREDADRRRTEIETAWSAALCKAGLDAATREHWKARLMAEPATTETTITRSKETK